MPASEASSDSTTSLTGRIVLGRYRVMRPLARGGMGVVYLGRVEGSAGFSKPVVIKSVLASFGGDDENERMFAREARIVSNLQHPGIVGVIDFGRVGNACVMVLEYVHGYHLGQWLRFVNETRGQLPVEFAVHAILEVLDALDYAHGLARPDGASRGIVHRDMSPANVLIDQTGHIKLSDFGIARMADDEFKTQEGLFRGTLPYSAPDTLHGESANPKVDQYGCGVMLYHLLAGKNPFKGAEPPETMARVLTYVPPSLSAVRKDVPRAIDAAIMRAISKEPELRFADVAEFAQALRAGCTWSERDAAQRFAAQIEEDFAGTALSEHLGVESLAVRDSSWRDAQDAVQQRVALSSSPPGAQSGVRAQGGAVHETPKAPVLKVTDRAAATARPPGRRTGLYIVLGAVAAGAVSAAIIGLLQTNRSDPAPRVLVIEKQGDDPPALASNNATGDLDVPPAATAEPSPVESASKSAPAPNASGGARAAAPPGGRGADLARAFQKQEGKIQGCFERNAGSTQGEPRISVRFQIDASGAVQNAIVTPGSVAGSPLGQCIEALARSTQFGPQPEPISFSIPIAARVVRR